MAIPARKPAPPAEGEHIVAITELDEWAQQAFRGYRSLNRIQSRIFQTAYHSNENILVCAPTGAGKTNIAMIAILREISLNMKYMVIQKDDFKIVYVAPMKALAAEMTATFGKRLLPLGQKSVVTSGSLCDNLQHCVLVGCFWWCPDDISMPARPIRPWNILIQASFQMGDRNNVPYRHAFYDNAFLGMQA